METIIATLAQNPISSLSLGALGVIIFFQLVQNGLLNIKIGGNKKETPPEWAQRLIQYANHDTTDRYKEIKEAQEKMLELMREHNKLDERVISILEEQAKYGVKCRQD